MPHLYTYFLNLRKVYRLLAITACCVIVFTPAAHARTSWRGSDAVISGKPFVYDGDSIMFSRGVEVRLDAIDAPEHDQACKDNAHHFWPCGIAARDRLRQLVTGHKVQCKISGADRYRRMLGICFADGRDLNAAMVASGNAIAYRYFTDKYASEEDRAKARAIGIWQDANFTEPFYCRHFHAGHTCYAYDFEAHTGRVASRALIGRSRAQGAPD